MIEIISERVAIGNSQTIFVSVIPFARKKCIYLTQNNMFSTKCSTGFGLLAKQAHCNVVFLKFLKIVTNFPIIANILRIKNNENLPRKIRRSFDQIV